ncbi:MAG: glycosyltransferase family 4 protein [Bacteroidales bacterium]|nr:glycosyltransferase family 4 protein [Bacteroidales bacterium]
MKNNICHLSSAHKRDDIRIFRKECKTLLNAGYQTFFIVADGNGDEIIDEINIIDVGKETSRIKRMTKTTKRILKKAIELNADIYHFHDPELMFAGLKLLKKGKKVIYDTHEDLPRQISGKPYLKKIIRKTLPFFIEKIENYSAKRFSYIITATPAIRDRFAKLNKNVTDINNYPILGELQTNIEKRDIKNQVCYIGGLTKIRGLKQVVDSLEFVDVCLKIGGKFQNKTFEKELKQSKGWTKVEELGFLSREEVKDLLSESIAGIVTFLPLPNHVDAQPNKIFEYMSAGLPVIGSNFDLWKQIIEENKCGICVDPEKPKEIAAAIEKLSNDKNLIMEMGENGKKAVDEKYNWQIEEQKLINIYSKILNKVIV